MSDLAAQPILEAPRLVQYYEREVKRDNLAGQIFTALQSWPIARGASRRGHTLKRLVTMANSYQDVMAALDDAGLQLKARDLKEQLRRDKGFPDRLVCEVFALIREASARVLMQRHYDVQLMGGFAMIKGMIAEMNTGEGKTLTATLAAVTAAFAGLPVHIVTVNDYLAKRDRDKMKPLYDFLGLSSGFVIEGMKTDARREAYHCCVTYCTSKELAFDYLRDVLAMGQRRSNIRHKLTAISRRTSRPDAIVMRGLYFVIVDEADSVLADEARTPLILSQQVNDKDYHDLLQFSIDMARTFKAGVHYHIRLPERAIELLKEGENALEQARQSQTKLWRSRIHLEESITQALSALHLMIEGENYIVREGKIFIVDEYTGRIMKDRFWSEGLHQLVELKEGCKLSGQNTTLARMTYQRFFRRYKHLCGMTGTADEISPELWRVYRLKVAKIPTHRPLQRRISRPIIAQNHAQKWDIVAALAADYQGKGKPLLIGTKSVAASLLAAAALKKRGVEHVVLNAEQDAHEANIIARAGQIGCVTIATNMAGRGTDISIAPEALERGGLHVIMTEMHDSQRIDRQLAGRCARQGEAGHFQAVLSLDDAVLRTNLPKYLYLFARWTGIFSATNVAYSMMRYAQRRSEKLHSRLRRDLLKTDEKFDHVLAFTGYPE